MKIKYTFFLFGLVLFSCQSDQNQLGLAADFFPSAKHLQKGFACKYYKHQHPDDKDKVSSTDIEYRTWQLISQDKIRTDLYDAALRLKRHTVYQLEAGKMKIIENHQIYRGDTAYAKISTNSIYLDWNGKEVSSDMSLAIGDVTILSRQEQQTSMQDTLIGNIPCKKFEKTGILTRILPTGDHKVFPSKRTILYAEGIGIYAEHLKFDERSFHTELIEQMTLEEFKQRANHGKKRIAYIDPEKTIDQSPDFKICNQELLIGDYYNCDLRGQLKGGKGSWWHILEERLSPQKLKKESGYLTYRFVLNCKGEAARFITEQADLDYNSKQFPSETIQHFYDIVSSQKDWQPCQQSNGESYDSYTYITFKLKNGKVIEILP